MKRISFIFIAFILLTSFSFGAQENTKDLKVVKNSGFYGILDKETNETIVPYQYKKIKKPINEVIKVKTQNDKWQLITLDNQTILEGEFDKVKISKDKYIGIYNKHNNSTHITSNQFKNEDFINKIYEQNNKISKIKFYNYPKEAVLILENKDKYGFIAVKRDKLIYVPPIYHEIYVPDNSTSLFRILGISLSDIENISVYDGYYWFSFDENGKIKSQSSNITRLASLFIDEDIKIQENDVVFNFKSKSDELKNIALTAFPKNNYYGIGKFLSYPKNRIEIKDDVLKIYENKKTYEIDRKNYEDFYFQDSNTIIFNIKNISFSNPDRIFAKTKGDWRIIDKNENVIAGLQYDDIIGLGAKEDVELIQNDKKFDFKYKNIIFPKNNIFLAKKDNNYSVMDINGKTLIYLGEIVKKENLTQSKKVHKKYEKYSYKNDSLPKTSTEVLMFKPYSTIKPILPSYLLFMPATKQEKKIFKKAL